jgi:hypothetical protein
MIINFITDSKRLETYNRLHLLAWGIFSFYSYYLGISWKDYFIVLSFSLLLGLILERVSFMRIGSGDTKMIVVSSIFLLAVTQIKAVFIPFFLFILYKIILLIIIGTFTLAFLFYSRKSINDKRRDIVIGNYKITIIFSHKFLPTISYQVPATGGIAIATTLLIFLFRRIYL